MRKFEIRYNDGAFYGEIAFNDKHSQEHINEFFIGEISRNNANPNKDYHITMDNIKEIK